MKFGLPLLAVGFLTIAGCATNVGYLLKQGNYLLRDSTGTVSIASLIEAPSTPAETRDFLLRVTEIKAFAVETIGLTNNGNYTRYKKIDRDHLVDVVQACDALSFTPYLWGYPFLGKLPYRGYYERADADVEGARLKKEGYDVIIRPVDAFSTLGFTKDPVYSFMKKYSPFQIASLIIHEQTHATLFVKDQPDFNEELANFVGDEGAFEWLRVKYGEDSTFYHEALAEYADSQTFVGLLQGLTAELKCLYGEDVSREEKLAGKKRIIDAFQARLSGELVSGFRTNAYRHIPDLHINNAYLSLYSLYSADVPLLRSYWEQRCGRDLRVFMRACVELAKRGDVKTLMREELAADARPLPP
jgi:predicted aminopeptidase